MPIEKLNINWPTVGSAVVPLAQVTSEPLHDNDRLTHINRDLHNVLEADTVRTSTDFIFPKTVPPRKLTIDLVSSASR